MMSALLKTILVLVFSALLLPVMAQTPKPARNKPAVQKFKPPKLYTILGIRSDSVTVEKAEAIQLVKLPLKITDDKKNVYTISSYQCLYKRKAVTEDDGMTGVVTPTSSIVTDLFKTTPLPDLWKNIITEQLQSGEEIYFYDIIVKDADGRLMFAPTLKIKVR